MPFWTHFAIFSSSNFTPVGVIFSKMEDQKVNDGGPLGYVWDERKTEEIDDGLIPKLSQKYR